MVSRVWRSVRRAARQIMVCVLAYDIIKVCSITISLYKVMKLHICLLVGLWKPLAPS
eukprot:COSAG06_NODE_3592_length_5143_cov_3.329104_3_plen_57_part_00